MSTTRHDDKGIVTACAQCGRKNRVPFERMGDSAQCGQCKADIPPPSAPLDIDSEARFDALVGGSGLPIVVDFWAPWCGPCRMVAPEMEKVAAANAGVWVVAKVNTEALPGLGARFGVRSIPTMAVFAGGREAARTSGARPARDIGEFVRRALAA